MTSQIYYREVNATWTGDDVLAISCVEYRVIKRTPKGAWIAPTWDNEGRHKRFVLDSSGKKFAYPTREAARASFIIRKKREIQHTRRQHDRAVRYLALAETGKFGERTEALHEMRAFDTLLPEIGKPPA